jgi:exopolysaccharide biosynthesis polyprenyl glycosylphosphotransferase
LEILGYPSSIRADTPECEEQSKLCVGIDGEQLPEFSLDQPLDEIIVEIPQGLSAEKRKALLDCSERGIAVSDLCGFFERTFARVYLPELREAWFWSYYPQHAHPMYSLSKRLMDITGSLFGLFVLAPAFLFIAALIKLQDGGPFIYSQIRRGQYNTTFRLYKWRTMRVDSEEDGPQWAKSGDPRVTWFGRILRKSRIDETPQLWNILKGEMSMIGPRPERPELIEIIEKDIPFYRYRHLIKPGLTGWAQINFPYGASVADAKEKLSYDLYYLKFGGLALDLLIIGKTLGAVAKGAR